MIILFLNSQHIDVIVEGYEYDDYIDGFVIAVLLVKLENSDESWNCFEGVVLNHEIALFSPHYSMINQTLFYKID